MPPQLETRGVASSPLWRIIAGAFVALASASLPVILALVVVATDPPVTPPVLLDLVLTFAALPALAAWLVARSNRATMCVQAPELVIRRRHLRIEVPITAIDRILVWRIPLPGPGFSIQMRSGRRLLCRLQARNPRALLLELADDCGLEAARAAADHPTMLWAEARAVRGEPRWQHLAWKFAGFSLLPAALLFNAHQRISYGALLGQYYQQGLVPWLGTLAVYWGTTAIYLVLYASVWRGLAEAVALATAWVAPSRARRVRPVVETACRALYYGGVPVLLLIRFLP